ncbi:uncharacterized protein LOC113386919 [Ctenocephalides felis]|uniref:uncharacterized protein LOC113386919 n=1 Tax=Ctenocephalides felis TaxID=7515 RepID=UPI000E6E58BF|nr:uncharacterized protein LOC113386919 [Ctenocephalides felis]
MSSLRDFIKNNRVLIVMIPAIIGIHVGWNMVQNNEIFVDEKDRKELPIVVGAKRLVAKIENNISPSSEEKDEKK